MWKMLLHLHVNQSSITLMNTFLGVAFIQNHFLGFKILLLFLFPHVCFWCKTVKLIIFHQVQANFDGVWPILMTDIGYVPSVK